MGSIAEVDIDLDDIRLRCLSAGPSDGPTVVFVHGFPDDAWSWRRQLDAFGAAGYRAFAPFLRGYPPSPVPVDVRTSSPANARDLVSLIGELGGDVSLVGHDWGGLAAHGAIALAPSTIRSAAVVAVSHPATLLGILEKPALVHHLFHIWFFQLEGLAEDALRANNFELIDYLWDHWTHAGHDDREHVARLKNDVFAQPGVVETLLSYYRALVRLPTDAPEFVAAVLEPTAVPTLAVWGSEDPARESAIGEHSFFSGAYEYREVPRAGHFVHRERPTTFNEVVLDFFARARDSATAR